MQHEGSRSLRKVKSRARLILCLPVPRASGLRLPLTAATQVCPIPCRKAAGPADIPGGLCGKHGPRGPRRGTLEPRRKDLAGAACSKLLCPPAPRDAAAPPDEFRLGDLGFQQEKGVRIPVLTTVRLRATPGGLRPPHLPIPSPASQTPAAAPTPPAESGQGHFAL